MASLPASNALIRRWVCSSNSSRLLSSHSPARPCASPANSCARRASSSLFSLRKSRVSCPVRGAIRRAPAAPSAAPNKNQPKYPESPRSLVMLISLSPAETLDEDIEPLLDADRQADQLPGPRDAADRGDDTGDTVDDVVDPLGHRLDALHLAVRFPC